MLACRAKNSLRHFCCHIVFSNQRIVPIVGISQWQLLFGWCISKVVSGVPQDRVIPFMVLIISIRLLVLRRLFVVHRIVHLEERLRCFVQVWSQGHTGVGAVCVYIRRRKGRVGLMPVVHPWTHLELSLLVVFSRDQLSLIPRLVVGIWRGSKLLSSVKRRHSIKIRHLRISVQVKVALIIVRLLRLKCREHFREALSIPCDSVGLTISKRQFLPCIMIDRHALNIHQVLLTRDTVHRAEALFHDHAILFTAVDLWDELHQLSDLLAQLGEPSGCFLFVCEKSLDVVNIFRNLVH